MGWNYLYFQTIALVYNFSITRRQPIQDNLSYSPFPQTRPYYIQETLETDHWKKFVRVTICHLSGEHEVGVVFFINSKCDKTPVVLHCGLIKCMIPFPYFPATVFGKQIHTSVYIIKHIVSLELVIASVLGLNLHLWTTSSKKLEGATVFECYHCWGLEIVAMSCILPNTNKSLLSYLAFTLSAIAFY